jgi:hypothetical protein
VKTSSSCTTCGGATVHVYCVCGRRLCARCAMEHVPSCTKHQDLIAAVSKEGAVEESSGASGVR